MKIVFFKDPILHRALMQMFYNRKHLGYRRHPRKLSFVANTIVPVQEVTLAEEFHL